LETNEDGNSNSIENAPSGNETSVQDLNKRIESFSLSSIEKEDSDQEPPVAMSSPKTQSDDTEASSSDTNISEGASEIVDQPQDVMVNDRGINFTQSPSSFQKFERLKRSFVVGADSNNINKDKKEKSKRKLRSLKKKIKNVPPLRFPLPRLCGRGRWSLCQHWHSRHQHCLQSGTQQKI